MSIQIDKKRILTGTMYAPFCRTLHVPMEEWDTDFRNMAELGFTCVHGFAEWHDIEYQKGAFDFTKIDYMVECAVRHGITPLINVATQNSVGFYSPRWLMEECRGKSRGFVDADGQNVYQGQYVVPCIDDPVYAAYANKYLQAVAKHFAGDSRIGGFVLWGEPTLYRPGSTRPICYCEHTLAKFRLWLAQKYKTIDALNTAWSSEGPADFESFDTVYPPTGASRQLGGFVSWDDFLTFMENNLVGHIKSADTIFKANGATQPTIVEMMSGIQNDIDAWQLSECVDIVGVSCFNRPGKLSALYMSMADSIGKTLDKSVFVVEAGGGSTKYFAPRSPSAEELETTLLQRISYDAKGVMYWCYRPRISDTEGNDFGMTKPNGTPLKKTVRLAKTAKEVLAHSDFFQNSEHTSRVAVLSSQKINHLMAAEEMTDRYVNAVKGAVFLLNDLHINTDFICEDAILSGALDRYDLLVLPCSYILSEECGRAIAAFVKGGGNVIADFILAEKAHGGLCYRTLPGAGLAEVFGIEREDVRLIEHPSQLEENAPGIHLGSTMEIVEPTSASVLAAYRKTDPLVTQNVYGKGTATYFAGMLFGIYATHPTVGARNTVKSLIAPMGLLPYCALSDTDQTDDVAIITSALYDKASGTLSGVLVSHPAFETVSDVITLPKGDYTVLPQGKKVVFRNTGDHTEASFTLGDWESALIKRRENEG